MIPYNVPINAQRMTIGVQGENNVREFLFDVTEWRQLTGDIGTAEMVIQRRGDSSPYAAVITMHDENTVSWIPVSADTAKAGAGKIQLMWIANGQTVKTKIFDMKVDPALDYKLPDDSLDPWASWVPDVINAAAAMGDLPGTVADAAAEWLEENIGPTTPAVDASLSVSGAAADAKVTGGRVDELKSALDFTESDGYFNNNGSVAPASANAEKYTSKIPIAYAEEIWWEYSFLSSKSLWAAYMEYDENENVIGTRQILINTTALSGRGKINPSENTRYVAFCYRTFGESDVFSVKGIQYNAFSNIYKTLNGTENTVVASWDVTSNSKTLNGTFIKGFYEIDASGLNIGTSIRCLIRTRDSTQYMGVSVGVGKKALFNIPFNADVFYLLLNGASSPYSGTVIVRYINNNNIKQIPLDTMLLSKNGTVNIDDDVKALNQQWSAGGKTNSNGRIAVGLFTVTGTFNVSLQNYSEYKFSVVFYNSDNLGTIGYDTGWITGGSIKISCDFGRCFGITLARTSGAISSLTELETSGLSIESDGVYYNKIATVEDIASVNSLINIKSANPALFSGRFKPCYDHLFVNKTGDNVIIPHESLYHVRLSHKMGYNTIEANIAKTSDGVYFVNHLNDGKFGGYFHHVDGSTDISQITASSVTWNWIVQNVRYNSSVPKYRTRPCTLEEFLGECKQQNIIPFVTSTEANVIAIVESVMGKENYIAYGAIRTNAPNAIIYHWVSNLTTKADILAYCKNIGTPFVFGMGNPTAFTDVELKDIVNTLHENGFWIGTSYADELWYKYSNLGFDFNGSQTQINRIESGNLYNLNSVFGFSDFDVTGGTETEGVLTFSGSGTIRPKIADDVESIVCVDIEVWFNGSITLSAIGERGVQTVTSDGSYPFFVCTPILNGSPKFTMTCASGTTVSDIKFKASKI